mgnify:CR=1 FL=1
MNNYLKIVFVFLFISSLTAQTLSVNIAEKNFYISSITRNELQYFSVRQFLQLFQAKYDYNDKTKKIEAEYNSNSLVVAGKNSFVEVLNKENNERKIFQMPLSTLLLNNDIYTPAVYSLNYLSEFLGRKVLFNDNSIIIEDKVEFSPAAKRVSKKEESVEQNKYDIEKIEIDEKANGILIRLKATSKINSFKASIQKNKLFVFFNKVKIDPEIVQNVKTDDFIKNIELKEIGSNSQLEFTFAPDIQVSDSLLDSMSDFESNDILISIFNKPIVNQKTETKIENWNFDTIVIDAGHGGKDVGAIGITGVKEKDVNLAIAIKLGALIKKNLPDIKVVYTRETDKFVELYKRGKIANENNGKLFISIHCNSQSKKRSSSRGFEVYLLRPGKTKQAIEIAQFENSVIKYEDDPSRYQELTDENFILVSMAHSSYMRYSEKFSEILNKNWEKYNQIPSRGVKQAGFYVLVGASMPSVLIETGFLSNPQDESILKSKRGQQNIANSIFQTIKNFKSYYNKQLEN